MSEHVICSSFDEEQKDLWEYGEVHGVSRGFARAEQSLICSSAEDKYRLNLNGERC